MSAEWYYGSEDTTLGPMSSEELRSKVLDGEVTRETRVRRGADGDWVTASQVKGLFEPPTPPLPASRSAGAAKMSALLARVNSESSTRVSLVMSACALALSLLALAWTLASDPLGKGIEGYDLSSPEGALRSELKMQLNQDIRARIQLDAMKKGKTVREKLETLKVHRTSDYAGKKLLFVSFTDNGISKYDVEAAEKDADTGMWLHTFVSIYDIEDSALQEAAERWEDKSGEVEK